MRRADTILTIHQKRGSEGLPLERVYKHLFDPEFYLRAYGKIYPNAGAMTKGSTEETVDSMSVQKIHDIIELLRQERYKWTPVRRVEIPKANGKTRPLGIPTWSDKLLQEVLRSLLEPYYEQRFSSHSHGFRPSRGCHSALLEIGRTWRGTKWFIEGDIKGCFDNVDHSILLEIIRRDIQDGRLVGLLDGLLKAGYMEQWRYHETASGTPQGGIISPSLANIYLNELDKFIEDWFIPAYTKGERRRPNPEYVRMQRLLRIEREKESGDPKPYLDKLRKLPSGLPHDSDYRRLRYIRYADDFLLGFVGPKDEAEFIRDRLAEFLSMKLRLELSKEKTFITHATSDKANFLGYEITAARENTLISEDGRRATNGNISLLMPRKAVTKLQDRYSRNDKIVHRADLLNDSVYTIIARYQSVLCGIYNYYCMAPNVSKRLAAIQYVLKISLTKTLACKLRTSVNKILRKYTFVHPDGRKMLRIVVQRDGKEPLIAIFGGISFTRKPDGLSGFIEFEHRKAWQFPGGQRSEVVQRLLAEKCELCGAEGAIQMHHIRKLADLNKPGRRRKAAWEMIMSARKRKTLAVCVECHQDIHAGRYDGPSLRKFTGEPDAVKAARPVRRGAIGKGTIQ